MTANEVLDELGFDRKQKVTVHQAPEKPYHPTYVAMRMDPNIRPVYHNGQLLEYAFEYDIEDSFRTGCVYVQYRSSDGKRYYIIGYNEEDVEYQIEQAGKLELEKEKTSSVHIEKGRSV